MIGGSRNRDEYVRLMRAGWSSHALEAYARHRHGEDVPASTFRSYKRRYGIESESVVRPKMKIEDDVTDVVGTRSELIRLQASRIVIDAEHEREMRKLFGTTGREIELLSRLLDAHKVDLQDLGLFPRDGKQVAEEDDTPKPDGRTAPRRERLADVVSLDEAAAARFLHEILPSDGKVTG